MLKLAYLPLEFPSKCVSLFSSLSMESVKCFWFFVTKGVFVWTSARLNKKHYFVSFHKNTKSKHH